MGLFDSKHKNELLTLKLSILAAARGYGFSAGMLTSRSHTEVGKIGTVYIIHRRGENSYLDTAASTASGRRIITEMKSAGDTVVASGLIDGLVGDFRLASDIQRVASRMLRAEIYMTGSRVHLPSDHEAYADVARSISADLKAAGNT